MSGRQNVSPLTVAQLQRGINQLRTRTGSGANPPGSRPAARRRARRNLANNARLRSIPKEIVAKPERFSRGAPNTSQHFAPRGQGYYDAFVCQPDALILGSQVGPCTPIEGFTRINVTGSAGVTNMNYHMVTGNTSLIASGLTDNSILIAFNPGSSDSVVAKVFRLGVNPNAPAFAVVESEDVAVTAFSELGPTQTSANLDVDHRDGDATAQMGPTGRIESIPTRGSLRIRNITENLAVGGEIRMLRYNGGISLGHDSLSSDDVSQVMGVAEYIDLCDMIRDTKRAHALDGHEVKQAHQSNTYPADFVRSVTFKDDVSFYEACNTPSYCTLLILVDNFKASQSQVNNTYSVAMTVQRAARFRPGTLLYSKAKIPHSHQGTHATHARVEANKPSVSPVGAIVEGIKGFASSPFADPAMRMGVRGARALMNNGSLMDMMGMGAAAIGL